MTRRCLRCKKEISQNDFLCPHCGLIIGDPVSYATSVKTKQSAKSRFPIRRMIYFMLIVVLVASVGVGVWLIRSLLLQQPDLDATGTTATVPQTTQTTAPLTVYTVQITTESTAKLTGICVHIYSGDQALYSSQVGDNGIATFILPESDGYSVRLTDLPVQYQVNYGESSFPFEAGQRDLTLTLEELPVTYTIKIVNSAGDPVPGTGILFYSTDEGEVEQVTDENGICAFITKYNNGNHSCTIYFAPNGYVVPNNYITFQKDRLEFEIELQTYEEAGYDPKDIYTVRVADEYGDPAPRVRLSVAGFFTDVYGQGIWKYGTTNMEGCFSFHYPQSLRCEVAILGNIDYEDTVFEFEEGQHDMQIQLDLHKEPGDTYTYTVCFLQPDSGMPVYGVQIAVTDDLYSDTAEYYTSDENGTIVFESTRSDPSTVHFYVTSCPDGYDFATERYTFRANSRRCTLYLNHDGKVERLVYLHDHEGTAIADAELVLIMADGVEYSIRTDEQGVGSFRQYPNVTYDIHWVNLIQLPDEFNGYVVNHIQYIHYLAESSIDITLSPRKETYTYTVNIIDQDTGAPVSGVKIRVDNPNGGFDDYTSNENGLITFRSSEYNPFDVYCRVVSCPDHLTTVYEPYVTYSFNTYERSCNIFVKEDGKLPYNVYLTDQEGNPVSAALFIVYQGEFGGALVETESDGHCIVRLPNSADLIINTIKLLEISPEYEAYVIKSFEITDDRCIYVTIGPGYDTPDLEG